MGRSVTADGSATADTETQTPISERRKHEATVFLRDHGPAFRATARRFAVSSQDAEDAYQRAAELFLTKLPSAMEPRARVNWMHVVVRHEALRLRRLQRRNIATEEIEELAGVVGRGAHRPESSDPADIVERKTSFDEFRQAYRRLKPDEQLALRLLGEGYSYSEIAERTDWSRTKINRLLAEGRSRMRTLLGRIEGGVRCAELAGPLSRFTDGEASELEKREVTDHLQSCLACRATLKSYRHIPRRAAALFPALPPGSWLAERFQALASWAQSRLPGRENLGDAIVLGSGSTGGAGGGNGLATLVKLAIVCAGAGGGTAVCVASGVLPVAPIAAIEKHVKAGSKEGRAPADAAGPEISLAASPSASETGAPGDPGNPEPRPAEGHSDDRPRGEAVGKAGSTAAERVPADPAEAEFGLEGGGGSAAAVATPVGRSASASSRASGEAPPVSGPPVSESRRPPPPAEAPPSESKVPPREPAGAEPAPDRLPPAGDAGEFGP